MEYKPILLIAGPCAVETYDQTMEMAYKVSMVRDAVQPFGIQVGYRGGAWKPRTRHGEDVFEGTREEGLRWLAEAGKKYDLPIVTECMSEDDLRHFGRTLDFDRDVIQIGARDNQNYALLYAVGGTPFSVLLKNPQHGVNVNEVVGSMERFVKNRQLMYCTRGQHPIIDPDGNGNGKGSYSRYESDIYDRPTQDKDARNLNNIAAIKQLRQNAELQQRGVLFVHDPSHTWGGKNERIRRKIGASAIAAITEYGYDGIEVDVYDRSADALVDGDQALLTTTHNVDWSRTNAGREPEIMPITLVDIAEQLVLYQLEKHKPGMDTVSDLMQAALKLSDISWDTKY